jgi:ankyrin repeat protein/mono/diheme cytochrome c family protein
MNTLSSSTPRARPLKMMIVSLLFVAPILIGADTLPEAVHRADAAGLRSLLASRPDLNSRDEDGNTALHWAARHGNARLVKELLERGSPATVTNHVGATPLLYAVGNVDSVRMLLDSGAEVNRASKFGTTPLIAAARYPQSSAVVRLLLDRGADPQANGKSRFNALEGAANAGDLASFRMLLAAGLKPENVISPAMMGHREIVEAALNAGADIQKDGGHAGHALNFALYGQQPAIARLLIERGADLSMRSPQGEHQTPPILWAAYNESGDVSVARLMIEKGVDVNMSSALGDSALDWARARNNKALEKVLLEAGAREGSAARKHKTIPNRELPGDAQALDPLLRQSVIRAIKLLQQTSDAFLQSGVVKEQKCVSCHQQTLPAVAFASARERGLPVDETSIARQVQDQVRHWKKSDKIARTYEMIPPQPDSPVLLGYGLLGLNALGYRADPLTEAMVWHLAATQRPDGSWPAADYRPPMEDGPIQGAAFAIRALQLYPLAGREPELKQRIGRARDYLAKSRPATFNQQVFQLLGLGWAGAGQEQLRPLVAAMIERQQPDGGWAQLHGLPCDSWATGQALVALNTVGHVTVSDPAFQKGIRFLLRTQFEDGSWYVRSRAWPFQPHFESGFPHGKDQWISAGATAWATMALLLTQPKIEKISVPDWMTVKVPDERKLHAAANSAFAETAIAKPKVDFASDIEPLLERSCAACHGGDRKRGKFSIASREAMLKGGQSGEPALLSGNSGASKLVRMVTDQVEDLEMPPLAKRSKYPALNKDEVGLVKAWIDQGLPWKAAATEPSATNGK